MSGMTERQLETWMAAMESRLAAMQTQIDQQGEQIGALIETKNLLLGDRQRQQAEVQAQARANGDSQAEKHATPVQKAALIRRNADKRQEERRNG